jgi:hypothetical protein
MLAHFLAVGWLWDDWLLRFHAAAQEQGGADVLVNGGMGAADLPSSPRVLYFLGFPVLTRSMLAGGAFSTGEMLAQSALYGVVAFILVTRARPRFRF